MITEFQETLTSIRSSDPEVNAAAILANRYTEMYNTGDLTPEQLIQILQHVQCQAAIYQQSAELESMEKLNIAINSIITAITQQ